MTPALIEIVRPVLVRWIAQPDVCANRLARELHAGGYAVVPLLPTPEMLHASRMALRRRFIPSDEPIPETRKHLLRLTDAVRTGQMQVLLEPERGR